jgi:hypothetical protein
MLRLGLGLGLELRECLRRGLARWRIVGGSGEGFRNYAFSRREQRKRPGVPRGTEDSTVRGPSAAEKSLSLVHFFLQPVRRAVGVIFGHVGIDGRKVGPQWLQLLESTNALFLLVDLVVGPLFLEPHELFLCNG